MEPLRQAVPSATFPIGVQLPEASQREKVVSDVHLRVVPSAEGPEDVSV